MGAERGRRWNCGRRTFRRRDDQSPRTGEGRHAGAAYRQGLSAWADVPRESDADDGVSFQRADVSLLWRDELRNPAPVFGSIAEPEVRRRQANPEYIET